jgi:hypothetical protein
VIEEGSKDTINGVDAAGAGQLLTLYAHVARGQFQPIATAVSGPGGTYSFPVSPLFSTYYRVTSSSPVAAQLSTGPSGTSGSTGLTGVTSSHTRPVTASAVAFVGVRVVLTLQTTPTTINQGQSVTFSGSVNPDETGRNIYLERLNATGTQWHIIASAVVGPNSQYSLSWSFYEIGSETLRVAMVGSPENQGNATPPVTVTVNAVPVTALVPAGG